MVQTITIDKVGRLVIPKEIRERCHLRGGSRLRLSEEGGRIVLEPIEEPSPLVERRGLLLVDAPLEGPVVDHRRLREERLGSLANKPR